MINSFRAALHTGQIGPGLPGDPGGQAPFAAVRQGDITALFPGQAGKGFDPENLRQKINNEEYVYGAIQRIAQVLSNELLKISRGGIYERQRKRRK
jgi:hypothetical protein